MSTTTVYVYASDGTTPKPNLLVDIKATDGWGFPLYNAQGNTYTDSTGKVSADWGLATIYPVSWTFTVHDGAWVGSVSGENQTELSQSSTTAKIVETFNPIQNVTDALSGTLGALYPILIFIFVIVIIGLIAWIIIKVTKFNPVQYVTNIGNKIREKIK